MLNSDAQITEQSIELRVGIPYVRLVSHQRLFVQEVGKRFGIDPAYILPMAGTTGAIEALRNHVFKACLSKKPTVLLLSPEYWRARESFQGLGFTLIELSTQQHGFAIDEREVARKAKIETPDLLYLSLPNNPTGATFDPEELLHHIPESVAVMLDLTLPSAELDPTAVVPKLHHCFLGRKNLFFVGSTSKSHGTAEHRIGWAICCHSEIAEVLRKENRNVIATASIIEGIKCLSQTPPSLSSLAKAFSYLRTGEEARLFEIVRPARMAESGYVLIKFSLAIQEMRQILQKEQISVMWGSEIDLPDSYMRLEMLDPANVKSFVDALVMAQSASRLSSTQVPYDM